MTTGSTIIHTHGLTKRYGNFTALQNLNLEVYQGEIFGYLGSNGAGKTTTIRTMLDMIRPSDGTVQIFGMDARQQSVAINARVGFLPAEMGIYQNMKALQYFRFIERARGIDAMAEVERLSDILDFDLTRKLAGLSTGNKRKVGLIQAMMHKPDLLILDEPTSGLDPLMQQKFNELMTEVRNEGRTVFLSSHNLTEIQALCDRVGILRNGVLEAVEHVETLTNLSFRWVTIEFEDTMVDVSAFQQLEGAAKLTADDQHIRLQLTGHMDALIKLAARYTVKDIRIENPSLEEIFLKFYGDDDSEVHHRSTLQHESEMEMA